MNKYPYEMTISFFSHLLYLTVSDNHYSNPFEKKLYSALTLALYKCHKKIWIFVSMRMFRFPHKLRQKKKKTIRETSLIKCWNQRMQRFLHMYILKRALLLLIAEFFQGFYSSFQNWCRKLINIWLTGSVVFIL